MVLPDFSSTVASIPTMADYYIRTPDHEESRGPFDPTKLLTLAEAGQISENTLYYDETKEEWVPIGLNQVLKEQVFPEQEKLKLNITHKEAVKAKAQAERPENEGEAIRVNDMLAAAEADTEETRHLKKKRKSLEKAASIATTSLGIMMLLSAVSLIMPHIQIARGAFDEGTPTTLLNYPIILVGLFDLIMGVLLVLAVTEVYPLLRGRAALLLGFGVYLAWALGDPLLICVFLAAGVGIFVATLAESFSLMLLATIAGIAGNGYLAYLAMIGRFAGFYDQLHFNFIPGGGS